MAYGRYALFSDPLTRVGGEKSTYFIPTYEALRGLTRNIYWKPTLNWEILRCRVMKRFRTETTGIKTRNFTKGGNGLSYYTYLTDVEYQVEARLAWNLSLPELKADRNEKKHLAVATRALKRGGRFDTFFGTRECRSYIEPCEFGEGVGAFDNVDEVDFGLMFHGFNHPETTKNNTLEKRFWRPVMRRGVIDFIPPDKCDMVFPVRKGYSQTFSIGKNMKSVEEEYNELGI
jgi:CRISPR-associated protein Cas5d